MQSELIHYFKYYIYVMIIEAVIYGCYIHNCLMKRAIMHRLFYASAVCFAVLLGEITRAVLLLWGIIQFTPKHLAVFGLELCPFGIVAYEILRKLSQKIYIKEWLEDITS